MQISLLISNLDIIDSCKKLYQIWSGHWNLVMSLRGKSKKKIKKQGASIVWWSVSSGSGIIEIKTWIFFWYTAWRHVLWNVNSFWSLKTILSACFSDLIFHDFMILVTSWLPSGHCCGLINLFWKGLLSQAWRILLLHCILNEFDEVTQCNKILYKQIKLHAI